MSALRTPAAERRARALPVLVLMAAVAAARAAGTEAEPEPPSAEAAEQGSSEAGDAEALHPFERVRVVGDAPEGSAIPGSASYLDEERLDRHDYDDVHRVLSQVPGVNLQEEEGYGLRPNIGMRGTGVERSAKITTMEDGVLIAPAPYSAPAAYYFPTTGRMEGLEVRKGSSSIQHGPYTNGGVLNLISSSIPETFGGRLGLSGGSDDTQRLRARLGGSLEHFGWLVETYQLETEGFKELDGGGPTGLDLADYLAKVRFSNSPGARAFHALELKLGRTDQSGQETYLGLTQEDFAEDPVRRYAASQLDEITTEHEHFHARYFFRPNDVLDLTATLYNNDFFRNWSKVETVNGIPLASVFDDPTAPENAAALAVLRAELSQDSADDALALRDNRRDYYSRGIQAILGIEPGGAGGRHDIEVSVRYHRDEEDRFQEDDDYKMTADGRMVATAQGEPGSQSNRVGSAEALAFYVQDTLSLARWTITPGLRLELIDFERVAWADAGRTVVSGTLRNDVNEVIPGIGVAFAIDTGSSVFGGVHRGFSPPGPSAVDADPEQSVNYELGYRRSGGPLGLQVVGFLNDYDNLLGVCTVSSGCSSADVGDVFNGGAAVSWGLEASARYDLATDLNTEVGIPLNLAYTYTRAEFRSSFDSDLDEWGTVVQGDELPYLPSHQGSLGLGIVHRRWSAYGNLVFVDAVRTVAGQGALSDEESTDAHLLLDLSAYYELRSGLKLFVQGRNLTDETYVAARRPAGARPGLPRMALFGVRWDF